MNWRRTTTHRLRAFLARTGSTGNTTRNADLRVEELEAKVYELRVLLYQHRALLARLAGALRSTHYPINRKA